MTKRRRQVRTLRARSGFSLIELVLVIGIVFVLIGLALPGMGAMRARAREVRDLALQRQNAIAVISYEVDFRCYPLRHPQAWGSVQRWYRSAAAGGYIPSEQAADPDHASPGDVPTIQLGLGFVASPKVQLQGWTEPDPPASEVRSSMLTYPSQKGMLLRVWDDPTVANPRGFCCGPGSVRSPIAFADASASAGRYYDFASGSPLVVFDQVGIPVLSTWGGCQGLDR